MRLKDDVKTSKVDRMESYKLLVSHGKALPWFNILNFLWLLSKYRIKSASHDTC